MIQRIITVVALLGISTASSLSKTPLDAPEAAESNRKATSIRSKAEKAVELEKQILQMRPQAHPVPAIYGSLASKPATIWTTFPRSEQGSQPSGPENRPGFSSQKAGFYSIQRKAPVQPSSC